MIQWLNCSLAASDGGIYHGNNATNNKLTPHGDSGGQIFLEIILVLQDFGIN